MDNTTPDIFQYIKNIEKDLSNIQNSLATLRTILTQVLYQPVENKDE